MNTRRKTFAIMGAVTLVFALACAEEPEVETTTVTETEATTGVIEEDVPRLPDGGQPVQVILSNMDIDMPSTLPEGRTLFTVRNEGDVEHSFEIEGQGIEKELEQHLQPGEVMTIEVDLQPGEYRVYCPVADHADRGMETTLTVTEGEGASSMTDTTGTDGTAMETESD